MSQSKCRSCREFAKEKCEHCNIDFCTNEECESVTFVKCKLCKKNLCSGIIPSCAKRIDPNHFLCKECIPKAIMVGMLCICQKGLTHHGSREIQLCRSCGERSFRLCRTSPFFEEP